MELFTLIIKVLTCISN